jgi:AsmA family protein
MAGGTRKLRDWRPPRWGVVGALALALIAGIALAYDDNWLKAPIERRVAAVTGRHFEIGGDLDVSLGRAIGVDAVGIALGNADWAKNPVMARAQRIQVDIDPWPLFRGRLDVTRIALDKPELLLERNARGEANWRFDPKRPKRSSTTIRALSIRDGTLRVREPTLHTDLRLAVETERRDAKDGYAPIVARGTGRYRNEPFELHGRLDSPLQLLRRGEGYRLDLTASAGETRLHAYGTLDAPIDPNRFAVRADASGQDLADLYRLIGIAAPETPPYRVTGRLSHEGDVWRYSGFAGKVGDSDMAGDVTLDVGGERPSVHARLHSRRLDFDDLGGLIGAPPDTKPGETASPEQRVEAQEKSASPRLLPDKPYNLEKLRSLDAVVQLKAEHVDAQKLPIEAIDGRMQLEDGLLLIEPLDVAIAGGHMTGNIRLDARQNPIATQTDLRLQDVEVPKLMPRINPKGFGRIAGQARLAGRGNSVAKMLATADGEVGAVMGSGEMSNLVLELAGLDVAESLILLLKDKTVPVRCAYTDLAVADGVATARSMALDTTDTVVVGSGTIDLADERLDLELKARPKDISPVSLRGPLDVDGTFKDPGFHPQPARLAGRVAAAAALFAIAPPAALLALFETGPGKDLDCAGKTKAVAQAGAVTRPKT